MQARKVYSHQETLTTICRGPTDRLAEETLGISEQPVDRSFSWPSLPSSASIRKLDQGLEKEALGRIGPTALSRRPPKFRELPSRTHHDRARSRRDMVYSSAKIRPRSFPTPRRPLPLSDRPPDAMSPREYARRAASPIHLRCAGRSHRSCRTQVHTPSNTNCCFPTNNQVIGKFPMDESSN